jgi:PAS domain S-box-containing protein
MQLLAPAGEVLGKNLWKTFPEAVYEGSPHVLTHRRAMEEGLPGNFEAYYPEPLNIWLAIESRPADDGIIIFFRDISAQRAAAEELRRKTEQAERQAAEIETLYRTAPIGLALFDTVDFRYLRLNNRQADFFGLKPEQVVGRTLTEMAPIPGLRELFEQVRAGNPVINYPLEGELISHPGEHRYWTVNYFPVHASDGSIQAISAASLEITQQKKAELALIQSEKLAAVGRLASSISHEINNPLEAVTNLLYLISSHADLPDTLKDYVELSQAELARVSQIATQTLRFYRQAARPTLVTAEQLVEPVLNLYKGRLSNSDIEVNSILASATPILCLENEIRQVLNNLIANAIDAMRTGGKLLVRAHDSSGSDGRTGVRITIADTGNGMDAATRKRIFEPFFTTKGIQGTGLGLWISAGIIERHHGALRVRSSTHPAKHGTAFSLFLPASEAS